MIRIDLHLHSLHSDGTSSVEELVSFLPVLAYDGSRVTADAVAARAGAKLAAADPIAEMPAGEGEITGK